MPYIRVDNGPSKDVEVTFGRERLIIHRRYETASILNDFLVAIWFLIGSIFFFYPADTKAGTWLFVIGSAQLLIRPCIRLAHNIHLSHLSASSWGM